MTAALTMADPTPEVRVRGDFDGESFSSGISLMPLCCLLSTVSSHTIENLFEGERNGEYCAYSYDKPSLGNGHSTETVEHRRTAFR